MQPAHRDGYASCLNLIFKGVFLSHPSAQQCTPTLAIFPFPPTPRKGFVCCHNMKPRKIGKHGWEKFPPTWCINKQRKVDLHSRLPGTREDFEIRSELLWTRSCVNLLLRSADAQASWAALANHQLNYLIDRQVAESHAHALAAAAVKYIANFALTPPLGANLHLRNVDVRAQKWN
jgi:hypothetical protein